MFTQIFEVAANAEALIKREKQEGEPRFSFRAPATSLNKRKDSLAVASTQYEKRKKDNPELRRMTSGKKGPGTRQSRRYDFEDQEMEGIYEELLKMGKI